MPRELGHDLLPLESVRATILSHLERLGVESCRLGDAFGRVLREDIVAQEAVPPFDNSAMDGFAVRAADLEGAGVDAPVVLPLVGTHAAGAAPSTPLEPGTATRIMTGAPMPDGAEAVVPHELTRFDAATVSFSGPVRPGQNVRFSGGDLKPGDVPLRVGQVLRGPQLAIAASLGYAKVCVTRPLRVGILSPGDELVEVGEACGPGKIRNSNAYSLDGALREVGAEPVHLGIVPDKETVVLAAMQAAFENGADAVVSTGGASAGDFDFVKKVVREHGQPGYNFKVAIRPGKPQVFGLIAGKPVFGLPGNPAAAIVSFEVFVRPALRRMRGESTELEVPFRARFRTPFRYKAGRVFLLRTRVEPDTDASDDEAGGGFCVLPPGEQDSSFLASLARANAIVILPADRAVVNAGEAMPAIWLNGRP